MSVRVDVFLLGGVSFQQGLAEAAHSCTVQSAAFALWFVIKLREKGPGFYFNSWSSSPHWVVTAPWRARVGVSCMYDDNRRAWISISGWLLSFRSHFKQPSVSGINHSKLAQCMDLQPKFRWSKNFYLLFFILFFDMFMLHPMFKKWKAKVKPVGVAGGDNN